MSTHRIHLSIQLTRRKFVHVVTDSDGHEVYLSRSIAQCFEWLYLNEHFEAEVVEGGRRWNISLSPLPI